MKNVQPAAIAAAARYASVRHLNDKDAAAVLGLRVSTVRNHRKQHPAARQSAPETQDEVKPSEDSQNAKQRYKGPPRRSAEVRQIAATTGYITTATVSLPREPWMTA